MIWVSNRRHQVLSFPGPGGPALHRTPQRGGRKVDWDNYAESSLRYAWGKGRAAEVRKRVSRGSRSVKCPSSA